MKPKLTLYERREAIARRDAGEVLAEIARTFLRARSVAFRAIASADSWGHAHLDEMWHRRYLTTNTSYLMKLSWPSFNSMTFAMACVALSQAYFGWDVRNTGAF